MDEKPRISFVRCEGYGRSEVRECVGRALALLGGPGSVAAPGESVFLKANNVIAVPPETAVVTHPEVMRAAVEEFLGVTDRVAVGDCPGGPNSRVMLKRVFGRTGLARVAEETGVDLAMDVDPVDVHFPDGVAAKRLSLCGAMTKADHLVSVSKFKSHRFMNVTGPIKNLFGAVPGMTKFAYHSRFERERDFADLVVDIHIAAGPCFHIVDAVEVMQGEGARSGDKRKLGFIAAGSNAFALEALVLDVAGLKPADSRPLQAAIDRGICPGEPGWFEVLGDDPRELAINDFRLPGRNYFSERGPALLTERIGRRFSARPRPAPEDCIGCGKCADVCPRGAITVSGGPARVDLKKCIRCFCCEELCEYGAMRVHVPGPWRRAGFSSGRRNAG